MTKVFLVKVSFNFINFTGKAQDGNDSVCKLNVGRHEVKDSKFSNEDFTQCQEKNLCWAQEPSDWLQYELSPGLKQVCLHKGRRPKNTNQRLCDNDLQWH